MNLPADACSVGIHVDFLRAQGPNSSASAEIAVKWDFAVTAEFDEGEHLGVLRPDIEADE